MNTIELVLSENLYHRLLNRAYAEDTTMESVALHLLTVMTNEDTVDIRPAHIPLHLQPLASCVVEDGPVRCLVPEDNNDLPYLRWADMVAYRWFGSGNPRYTFLRLFSKAMTRAGKSVQHEKDIGAKRGPQSVLHIRLDDVLEALKGKRRTDLVTELESHFNLTMEHYINMKEANNYGD